MDETVFLFTMDAMTFGKRLREARLAAGLTQQQVATACGVTDGAVSAWENGVTSGIIADTLFCAADLLRVDPRWLATGAEAGESATDLARALKALPAEQQDAVRALIKTLNR